MSLISRYFLLEVLSKAKAFGAMEIVGRLYMMTKTGGVLCTIAVSEAQDPWPHKSYMAWTFLLMVHVISPFIPMVDPMVAGMAVVQCLCNMVPSLA